MLSARFHTDAAHHYQAESRLSIIQPCLFIGKAMGHTNPPLPA